MDNKIHFVLNSHGLGFDKYSLLCIKSIRHVCGNDVQISVYCPDNLPSPSDLALRFYDRHNVNIEYFHNEFLPAKLTDLTTVPSRHLTYNKLYTLTNIKQGERRIFIDADIIFLKDPRSYFETIQESTACVAVDTPESFPGDWQELYQNLGVPFPQETIEVWQTYPYGNALEPPKVRIPPFFCSNVIAVSNYSNLPTHWLSVCKELDDNIHWLPRSYFVDQVGLSIAVQKAAQPFHLLPRCLNTAYEIWPYVDTPVFFHYVTFDTLAAGTARFPELKKIMHEIVTSLAREDGLDLRFQLLTEYPRLYRRALNVLLKYSEKFLGAKFHNTKERV